ncbi:hypothetical protein LCGC14_0387610 [marine sediment metagenome]|uniref:Uncharacterized protein n=1 Tax=marine sediment metagenome TaxID=412755 RepID=A0A0F9T660_9ZZZZ
MKPRIGEIIIGNRIGRRLRDKYMWCACKFCGKERWVRIVRYEPRSVACVTCANKPQNAPNYKGEKLTHNGYVREHNKGYKDGFEKGLIDGGKESLKKVVEWLKDNARTGYRYTDDYTHKISWEYDTKCDNEMMIDLGDWQALSEEAK